MLPAELSLPAEQRSSCEIRHQLTLQLEVLLESYAIRILQFSAVYGFIGAEKRCQSEYAACVEAREALKTHLRKHGCDSEELRPYLVP